MKSAFTLILLSLAIAAQAQKPVEQAVPKWNISFHFDHISLPFFGKYKPSSLKSLKSFTTSWRVSIGRTVLHTGDDHTGGFRSLNIGYIKNAQLQHGLSLHLQQGFHLQANNERAVFFQPALEAGALLLFQKWNSTVHEKRFAQRRLRLQWTGGLTMNAGYGNPLRNSYAASAVSYKMWLQGPFIKKYAPAVPHQSFGIVVYK